MGYLKILVIGEIGSGKSSIVYRLAYNSFSEKYKATIGCEFGMKSFFIDGNEIKVQLWDLAGQDRLSTISRVYCRDASGAIVVADLTDRESMQKAPLWKRSVDENVSGTDGNSIPMILCLNKVDLVHQEKPSDSTLTEIANQHGFLNAFCTSARTGESIEEALDYLIRSVKDTVIKSKSATESIMLNLEDHSKLLKTRRFKKCC